MPLKSTILQKYRSLQLSFPSHSSAPSIPHESVCTSLGPRSISFSPQELPLLQPSAHQCGCVPGSAAVLCEGGVLSMFPAYLQTSCFSALQFKGLLQKLLHDRVSGSSYAVLESAIFVSSSESLALLGCHL